MKSLSSASCNALFAFVLLFTNACKKENMCDCLKSTGSNTTDYRNISGFTKIDLHNNVDLIITPGKTFDCKVTAGRHLVDMITTEVSGQTLVIKNKNKCNWVRSFKNKFTVEVSMPVLEALYYDGSGTVTSTDTIRTGYFTMNGWNCSGSVRLLLNCQAAWLALNSGTSDLTATGYSGTSYIYSGSTGPLHCHNLSSDFTYITNNSTNDCYVSVQKEMNADLPLTGNIYYSGKPYHIQKQLTGTGKLIHQ